MWRGGCREDMTESGGGYLLGVCNEWTSVSERESITDGGYGPLLFVLFTSTSSANATGGTALLLQLSEARFPDLSGGEHVSAA